MARIILRHRRSDLSPTVGWCYRHRMSLVVPVVKVSLSATTMSATETARLIFRAYSTQSGLDWDIPILVGAFASSLICNDVWAALVDGPMSQLHGCITRLWTCSVQPDALAPGHKAFAALGSASHDSAIGPTPSMPIGPV